MPPTCAGRTRVAGRVDVAQLLQQWVSEDRPEIPSGFRKMQSGRVEGGAWKRYYSRREDRTLLVIRRDASWDIYEYSGNAVPSCCRGR